MTTLVMLAALFGGLFIGGLAVGGLIGWGLVEVATRLFPSTCDRCGGHYVLGHLDKHYANDCTDYVRNLWNNR